ncbi:MAG TPA: sulfite exporter TauE/SafE family protein, partial [Sphingomicrobium sp.]|nr:sulfite exporter TauE/SafE family protein [Sphingomicrobium sp.]
RLIPPTMVAGLTPPVMVESIIFLILLGVFVDPVLLFGCAIATMLGGLAGAPLVARARVWIVQAVVAIGLVLAAIAYAMTNLHLFPGGGTATGLPISLTLVSIVASFGFGILANFGVGNYAPTLVMLSLMGMDPRLCFPIMAAGGSLMGAGASLRHVAIGQIDLRIVLGLAIGGIPAVLVAAFVVKSMPLEILRWLVFVVVLYAAAIMFRAALVGRRDRKAVAATAEVAIS